MNINASMQRPLRLAKKPMSRGKVLLDKTIDEGVDEGVELTVDMLSEYFTVIDIHNRQRQSDQLKRSSERPSILQP